MLDQSVNQQPLSEDVLRAFLAQRPAVMGPPTEACSSWLLGGTVRAAQPEANVVLDASRMSGGLLGPQRLSARIRSAALFQRADVPIAEIAAAVGDAAVYSDKYLSRYVPAISVTEEGAVLLSWERDGAGVALLFVGDGTVVYSISDDEVSYSESGIELPIHAPPPAGFNLS